MLAVIVALHLIGWITLIGLVEPARLSVGGKAFGIGVGLTASPPSTTPPASS
jgi:nickel/cobalt transporter (NiCoT) family protein